MHVLRYKITHKGLCSSRDTVHTTILRFVRSPSQTPDSYARHRYCCTSPLPKRCALTTPINECPLSDGLLALQPINTTNGGEAVHSKLFEREPFFRAAGVPKSVIVAPLFVQGRLSGAIYLANRATVPSSSTSHVGLLATFAAIILKSHHAYAALEAAVETRTNQLEQALAHRQTFINAISHEVSRDSY